jgi:hypothetical protein
VYLQTLELQGVKILWEDKSGKEDGYKVEKNSGSGFTEIATLPANSTSYLDTISGTPTPPLNLTYRVKAYNATLASSWKEISTAYSGIGSPTNLIITDSSFWKFTIQWQRNSSIATGYVVERKKDVGNYITLANVGATISSYVDTLKDSGSYSYRVKAKKDNLYSAYSNEVVYNLTEVLPTQGLVAYYPFNGNANDESGNGNNGTVNGATLTTDRFGRVSKAYSFNGTNAYILINNSISLSSYSVVCWVLDQNLSDEGRFFSNGGWGDGNYNGAIDFLLTGERYSSNRLAIINQNGSGQGLYYSSTTIGSIWTLVAATYEMNGNVIKLYVNGTQVTGSMDNGFWNYMPIPNVNPVYKYRIGCNGGGTFKYFNGLIDDIRIYNRALTEQEIQALYHEGGW